MPRSKDDAICIRHLDWSETSQIVVLLTRAHGKVRGIAKGSKRSSPSAVQRYSGGIELLTRGEVLAVVKPTSDLAAITEWDLQNDHHHLRRNLRAQHLAMYAADVCHALLADHDPHPRTFESLATFIEALAEIQRAGPALLRFQWDLLDDLGYRPELDRDASTGGELPEQAAYTFDPRAGGITQLAGAQEWRVRAETVETLRAAARAGNSDRSEPAAQSPPEASPEVPPESLPSPHPETVARANRLLCVYIRALLDQELPTMRVVLRGAG